MIRLTIAYGLAVFTLCGCTGEFPTGAQQLQAAKKAYDSQLLIRSLDEIEAWHVAHDTGVAGILKRGRSASSIAEEFSQTECVPTEELKTFWSWNDGAIGPTPFVWYHDFLPLEEALSEYQSLLLNPLVQWDPRYIPILAFEGEWYAAYCGAGVGAAGPIVHIFLEDEPRIAYVNLTTFMASMSEMLRSGAIEWKNGAMVEDIQKVYSIHQKYNRGYDFPYYVPDGNQGR